MKNVEFIDREKIPEKPGKLQTQLFPLFEQLVKEPSKALKIDLAANSIGKATLYYVLRKWNKGNKTQLHYVLADVRTHPLAYIYAEESGR